MKTFLAIALVNGAMLAGMIGASKVWAAPDVCVDTSGRVGECQYLIDYSGETRVYVGLPQCPYEDGNPNGEPCAWHSPRGVGYYVDSSEYRR